MIYSELVKSQLAKDAPFSWFLFDRAKSNSRYRYPDFKERADSTESYLHFLELMYAAGEEIETWLDMDDWGSCFVLAALGIRLKQDKLFDFALDNLQEEQETHYREIVDACIWDNIDNQSPWLIKLHRHRSPVAQQAAIAAARSKKNAIYPEILDDYVNNRNPAVQIQFLNWLSEHKGEKYIPHIVKYYDNDNHGLAFAAARAGFLLGDGGGISRLEQFSLQENPHMLDAASLIFIREQKPAQLKSWMDKLWADDDISIRVKLYGAAISGLPQYVDKMFEPMTDKDTARAAGEAFTILTGVDIEEYDLNANDDDCDDCDEDITDEPTLAERRKEDQFISDWEDDLAYPCPDAVSGWWHRNQDRFSAGTRYLSGLELTGENLKQTLKTGNQRQRKIAALHLFINHNHPWIDCGWPPAVQENGGQR